MSRGLCKQIHRNVNDLWIFRILFFLTILASNNFCKPKLMIFRCSETLSIYFDQLLKVMIFRYSETSLSTSFDQLLKVMILRSSEYLLATTSSTSWFQDFQNSCLHLLFSFHLLFFLTSTPSRYQRPPEENDEIF